MDSPTTELAETPAGRYLVRFIATAKSEPMTISAEDAALCDELVDADLLVKVANLTYRATYSGVCAVIDHLEQQ